MARRRLDLKLLLLIPMLAVLPPALASGQSKTPAATSRAPAAPIVTAAQPPAALSSPSAIAPVDDTSAGQRLYVISIDGARDDPANWSVHVFKSRHRMEVYYRGRLFRVYHAVFGRSRWAGGKEWEGDTRTPEGSYFIIQKRRSRRFDWFLKLNYPNGLDQEQFVALKEAHQIPARLSLGGNVGIHGTDDPRLNRDNVNWTLGCISVDNQNIEEMAALLPVGTLVVIKP